MLHTINTPQSDNKKHIVVFSHGFGVRKDDRGLFTDIASSLEGIETVMFDYNEYDEANNTLTVRPFSQQAELLKGVLAEQRRLYPHATVDLVCHSQGCKIAAIVKPQGIRKTVLIAPPTDTGIERTLERVRKVPGTVINLEGISRLQRTDGSITIVPSVYWEERKRDVHIIDSYNQLSENTQLIIIKANQDTVLGDTSFEGLREDIKLIALDGNHDFTGEARKPFLDILKECLV